MLEHYLQTLQLILLLLQRLLYLRHNQLLLRLPRPIAQHLTLRFKLVQLCESVVRRSLCTGEQSNVLVPAVRQSAQLLPDDVTPRRGRLGQ